MFDDLLQLLDSALRAAPLAIAVIGANFCLRALLVLVATFGRGEHGKSAYRVLKVLSRRKRPRGS